MAVVGVVLIRSAAVNGSSPSCAARSVYGITFSLVDVVVVGAMMGVLAVSDSGRSILPLVSIQNKDSSASSMENKRGASFIIMSVVWGI